MIPNFVILLWIKSNKVYWKQRLSDDVPVQADTVPLVNIYFTLCMSFSLNAMIWFSYINLLRERKRVPKFCRYLVVHYICFIMRVKVASSKALPTTTPSSEVALKPDPASVESRREKSFSVVVANPDGTNKSVLAHSYPISISSQHIASDQAKCSSTARPATYYRRINESTSFGTQFTKNRLRGDDLCAYATSSRVKAGGEKGSRKKKRLSTNLSREKTQSDSGDFIILLLNS